ncbi:MAG: 16S rRNA (adenine(1518)-N(6)/adenine(1519)-N(6))-dimethyltransferase RsmA [Flavobacteriaceae bacterium]|nr:16S rRNA (adenine(1518)-N(6)/adenine(1519)-N(6))-dimethyltransferase RsmA [Flavobacteriaceae bacterium]
MSFVKAKKHLGQHFLRDDNIAIKIVQSLDKSLSNSLIEIGPGTGVLTKFLINENYNLKLIEIDSESVNYLVSILKFDSDNILEGDFLKMKIDNIFNNQFSIIGNFPYNISTQIIFKVLENKDQVVQVIGMFQKEVAERICEKKGTKKYGILSVLTQAYYNVDYLFEVPPSVFNPPPKVKSAVIKLIRIDNISKNYNEELFYKIVKLSFQQRRKTLRNSLKIFNIPLNLREDAIFGLRPEQLSVSDFINLTNLIANI